MTRRPISGPAAVAIPTGPRRPTGSVAQRPTGHGGEDLIFPASASNLPVSSSTSTEQLPHPHGDVQFDHVFTGAGYNLNTLIPPARMAGNAIYLANGLVENGGGTNTFSVPTTLVSGSQTIWSNSTLVMNSTVDLHGNSLTFGGGTTIANGVIEDTVSAASITASYG